MSHVLRLPNWHPQNLHSLLLQKQGRISSPHDSVRLHNPRTPGQGIDTWRSDTCPVPDLSLSKVEPDLRVRKHLLLKDLENLHNPLWSANHVHINQVSENSLSPTRILPWAALRAGCNPSANSMGIKDPLAPLPPLVQFRATCPPRPPTDMLMGCHRSTAQKGGSHLLCPFSRDLPT